MSISQGRPRSVYIAAGASSVVRQHYRVHHVAPISPGRNYTMFRASCMPRAGRYRDSCARINKRSRYDRRGKRDRDIAKERGQFYLPGAILVNSSDINRRARYRRSSVTEIQRRESAFESPRVLASSRPPRMRRFSKIRCVSMG